MTESPDLRATVNQRIRQVVTDLEGLVEQCSSGEDLVEAAKLASWLNVIACRVLGMSLVAHSHDGQIPEPRTGSYGMRASYLLEDGYFGDRAADEAFLNALLAQRSTQYVTAQLAKNLTERLSSL
ncbi:hypothetical protein [Streptomyces sp. NPDC088135]|uniref:hypothetical protein n=1 Tax=Streptomyces sp. NPDC088135 TaxID=3160993 RepID=UPI00341DF3CD